MGDAPKTDTLAARLRRIARGPGGRTTTGSVLVPPYVLDRAADEIDRLRAALAAHDTPPTYEIRSSTSPFCACSHEQRQHDGALGCTWLDCACERFVAAESGVLRDPEPQTPTCICDHPKDDHSYAWDDEPGDPMACDVLDCTCGEYTEQAEGGQLDPEPRRWICEKFDTPPFPDALAEGGQLDPDDELLARVHHCGTEVSTPAELVGLAHDLASALRRKREQIEDLSEDSELMKAFRHRYWRDRDRADRLERELAEARSGLQHINRHGCEHFTRGSCLTDPSRSRDAEYGADQWCDPCIAADALGRRENSRPQEKETGDGD